MLLTEIGNTKRPIDNTNFREEHDKIKIIIKDCLNAFWINLHFKKDELEEVFIICIQE
ncbi:1220_t:CDS:2 [Funneliformis geosporum]|uniref:1220_t:CDS:1 n=1 Tax=Funneliformis geosporum TaxID=1117311 RepID=A0A9W4SP09_9GLOM|nr:1220_t:CDS:2 [Funneliformis geosporum]